MPKRNSELIGNRGWDVDDAARPEIGANRRAHADFWIASPKRSTIYNLKNQAEARLERDNVFFVQLHHLRVVRDRARLAHLRPASRRPSVRRPPAYRDRRLTPTRRLSPCAG
jgi:hypothetical protein